MTVQLSYARVRPVGYARMIGVKLRGKVPIYCSSYEMFNPESFLVTLHENVFISVGTKAVVTKDAPLSGDAKMVEYKRIFRVAEE